MLDDDYYLYPVDIGQWSSYAVYTDSEQYQLQHDHLLSLPVHIPTGPYQFIYTKQIHRLDELLNTYPDKLSVIDTEVVLADEIFFTAKIEGAKTTRVRTTELHNGAPINKHNEYSERMVKNGFQAVKMLNLYGNKVSVEILRKVWETLTERCRDNAQIAGTVFRNGDIYVGSHQGVSPDSILPAMEEWVAFYNSPELDSKPFIKAAMLHFMFEHIHPFCDGNGRMGRLLINNYLISRGVESAKAVSFSMQIDKTRAQYDAALSDGDNIYNDLTPFIHYMLQTMISAYDTAVQTQTKTKDIKEK